MINKTLNAYLQLKLQKYIYLLRQVIDKSMAKIMLQLVLSIDNFYLPSTN